MFYDKPATTVEEQAEMLIDRGLLMSLGELSQWFSATAGLDVRGAVARDMAMESKEVLEGVLQVFALIQNVCAHHGRLWSRRLVKRLPTIKRLAADMVFEVGASAGQVQKSIHNSLVMMLYVPRARSVDLSPPRRLAEHMDTAPEDQRATMGLPGDWRKRRIWGAA